MLSRSDAMEYIQEFLEENGGSIVIDFNKETKGWSVFLTYNRPDNFRASGIDESLAIAIEKCLTEAGVEIV